jgi:mannitol-specific phosphotransferase system IIBC component
MQEYFDKTTKAGTLTGTFFTVLSNLTTGDLIRTIILAAVGALASFIITILLKALNNWFRKS